LPYRPGFRGGRLQGQAACSHVTVPHDIWVRLNDSVDDEVHFKIENINEDFAGEEEEEEEKR
jgi:hypothetical protein